MGFDQYHEPPDELPAETRTFARLCASLTEEAEAIGWYEQRLAVETDPEALAVMRDAQGEEFKHFSMDLEFLLRRTPPGVRSRAGDPLPDRRHRRARRGGRGRSAGRRASRARRIRGRLAGNRQPEGSGAMNHLLRDSAPISDAGWELLDEEARERLDARARRAQARRLLRAARLGVLGDQPRARHARWTPPPGDGVAASQRRVLPLIELRADFALSRAPSCATPTAAPTTSTSTQLDRAAHQIARGRERRRVPRLAGRDRRDRRGLAARAGALGDAADSYPRQVAGAVERLLCSGIAGPYGLALGREQYRRVVETAEHGGYPLLRPPAQDPRRPDRLGARRRRRRRRQPARRRLPVRVRPGPLDRLRLARRRGRPALPRGELQLPRRDARGRGRAEPRRTPDVAS